jgi:hypothetical protein
MCVTDDWVVIWWIGLDYCVVWKSYKHNACYMKVTIQVERAKFIHNRKI